VGKRIIVAMCCVTGVVAVLVAQSIWGPRSLAAPLVDDSFVVEPPMAEFFDQLDEREQREQIRDWAVVGALTHLGASAEELARATYESPPARLPYLDELYSFEQGRGRHAYFRDRVLLFRDADDPDPQTTLGRLADRVRMENGDLPRYVQLYLVSDDRDNGVIRIERAADVSERELFSSSYGYVEAKVSTAEELTRWLEQVDDLTSATMEGSGSLRLGGRRFANTRTANITGEDVAAIYQARLSLAAERRAAMAAANALPPSTQALLSSRMDLGVGLEDLLAGLSASESAIVRHVFVTIAKGDSPGFSLDPEWLPDPSDRRHPLLLSKLRAFIADPCQALRQIINTGGSLLQDEPDESRRSSRTVSAEAVMMTYSMDSSKAVCQELKAKVPLLLSRLVEHLRRAPPGSWDSALVEYHQLMQSNPSTSGVATLPS
jgi:hypothetical protein